MKYTQHLLCYVTKICILKHFSLLFSNSFFGNEVRMFFSKLLKKENCLVLILK